MYMMTKFEIVVSENNLVLRTLNNELDLFKKTINNSIIKYTINERFRKYVLNYSCYTNINHDKYNEDLDSLDEYDIPYLLKKDNNYYMPYMIVFAINFIASQWNIVEIKHENKNNLFVFILLVDKPVDKSIEIQKNYVIKHEFVDKNYYVEFYLSNNNNNNIPNEIYHIDNKIYNNAIEKPNINYIKEEEIKMERICMTITPPISIIDEINDIDNDNDNDIDNDNDNNELEEMKQSYENKINNLNNIIKRKNDTIQFLLNMQEL